jgi:hypothetical protein
VSEVWTPKTQQSESWASIPIESRPNVFTSRVFASRVVSGQRVFATGSPAGLWDAVSEQSETWTVVS